MTAPTLMINRLPQRIVSRPDQCIKSKAKYKKPQWIFKLCQIERFLALFECLESQSLIETKETWAKFSNLDSKYS